MVEHCATTGIPAAGHCWNTLQTFCAWARQGYSAVGLLASWIFCARALHEKKGERRFPQGSGKKECIAKSLHDLNTIRLAMIIYTCCTLTTWNWVVGPGLLNKQRLILGTYLNHFFCCQTNRYTHIYIYTCMCVPSVWV